MNFTSPELSAIAIDLANDLSTVWSYGSIAFAQGPPRPSLAQGLLDEWNKDRETCKIRTEIMQRYAVAFTMVRLVAALLKPHPAPPNWVESLEADMYAAIEAPTIARLKEIAVG